MFKSIITVSLAIASLSACGGTTLGVAEVGSGPLTASELNAFASEFNEFRGGGTEPTSSASLRASGSATYNGVLAVTRVTIGDEEYGGLIGRSQVIVGFAGSGSVTGRATDFVYSTGEVATGTLTDSDLTSAAGTINYSNGSIDRTKATAELEFDVSGNLSLPSQFTGLPGSRNASVSGELSGAFIGENLVVAGGPTLTGDGIDFSTFAIGIAAE